MVLWVACLAAARSGAAERPLVAVVFAQRFHDRAPGGEGRGARTYTDTAIAALDAAGVAHARLRDRDVEAGRLAPYAAAVFPYNTVWPEALVAAIERYVAGGGKALFFYSAPEPLHRLVGTKDAGWTKGAFAAVRLRQALLPGLPRQVRQGSWNTTRVQPATADAQVVGEWLGPDGKPLGEAALIVSPRGAFMGHVLTPGDVEAKGRMLLAVLGKLVPEVWRRASRRAVLAAHRVGPLTSLDALAARAEDRRLWRSQRRRGRRHLAEARELLERAADLSRTGQHAEAIDAAHKARAEAASAFAATSLERRAELRGTWIHTAYGVKDWGWRRSIRHLRTHGFNAILPNMLWGGLAHYPSDLLPVSPKVAERGDQIAECLRWCKRYGVELHVWKVNYNLSTAPKAFVEKMRQAKRLQHHRNGSELRWLCPSHPDNFALERDSMLEVVRNYDVHGIHFDYIRYPGAHACFCDGCRQRFEQAAGVKVAKWPDDVLRGPHKATFTKWRQDQITNLVREVSREAHRIRPGVQVSAAVFGAWDGARYSVGQDWVLWVREGLLDFVCPMDYFASAASLEKYVAKQVEWVGGRAPLYIGIGAWRVADAPGLVHQLERARWLGADGFVCFHCNDLELTDRRMPALALAHTAHRTRPPHPAPRAAFAFPSGLADVGGLAFAEGAPIPVAVSLSAEGNYPRTARSASGRLYVETTDGERVKRLGRVHSSDGKPLRERLSLAPGRYRLAVSGSARFGWFRSSAFVVRSRPFSVVVRAAAEAVRAKGHPPRFAGEGIRVGVAVGGYGSDALLAALREAEGIDAMALHKLDADFLKPCQVAVLAQPRRGGVEAVTAKALADFVAAGGGLLATHDAPGYRTHPVLIPDICKGGTDRIEGTAWRPRARHPLTEGLPLGQAAAHSYYDAIGLAVGPRGGVAAEAIGTDGQRRAPVVVCGQHGRGRYVACGLALGLGKGDRDAPPTGAERRLLLNAVRWLADR